MADVSLSLYGLTACSTISRTNYIDNSTIQGAVVGTPGTIPTGWAINPSNGTSRQIVATGVDSATGLNYIDVRFYGTTTAAGSNNIVFNNSTTNRPPASLGQTWTHSLYVGLVAGAWPSGICSICETRFTHANTSLGGLCFTDNLKDITSSTLVRKTRVRANIQPLTIVNWDVAYYGMQLNFFYALNEVVDFTIRIAAPQLELQDVVTAFIPTYTQFETQNLAVHRPADINGYTQQGYAEYDSGPNAYYTTDITVYDLDSPSTNISVGSLTPVQPTLIGAQAGTNTGTLTTSQAVSLALTKNTSTTNIGTLTASQAKSLALTENTSTTNIGNLVTTQGTVFALTKNTSTTNTGTLTTSQAVSLALTKNTSTTNIGSLTPVQPTLIGAQAGTNTGTLTTSQAVSLALTKNTSTTNIGNLVTTQGTVFALTKNTSTTNTGTLTTSQAVSLALTKNTSTTNIGNLTTSQVSSTSIVGHQVATSTGVVGVTTDLTISLNSSQSLTTVGNVVTSQQTSVPLTGLVTNTNNGNLLKGLTVTIPAVSHISSAGVVTTSQTTSTAITGTQANITIGVYNVLGQSIQLSLSGQSSLTSIGVVGAIQTPAEWPVGTFKTSTEVIGPYETDQDINLAITYSYYDWEHPETPQSPGSIIEYNVPAQITSMNQRTLNSITSSWSDDSIPLSTLSTDGGIISGYVGSYVFNQKVLTYTSRSNLPIVIDGRKTRDFWATVDAHKTAIGHIHTFQSDPRSAIECEFTAVAYDGYLKESVVQTFTMLIYRSDYSAERDELMRRL